VLKLRGRYWLVRRKMSEEEERGVGIEMEEFWKWSSVDEVMRLGYRRGQDLVVRYMVDGRGIPYVDIRYFVEGRGTEEKFPCRKGIVIRYDVFRDMMRKMREVGLLEGV